MAYSDQPSPYGGKFVVLLAGYGAKTLLGGWSYAIPAIFTVGAQAIIARTRPHTHILVQWALALVFAQAAWMGLAVVVQPQLLGLALLDIILFAGLFVWLLLALSKLSAIAVMVVEAAGVVFNGLALARLDGWHPEAAPLIVQIFMRSAVVVMLGLALRDRSLVQEPEGQFSDDGGVESI